MEVSREEQHSSLSITFWDRIKQVFGATSYKQNIRIRTFQEVFARRFIYSKLSNFPGRAESVLRYDAVPELYVS